MTMLIQTVPPEEVVGVDTGATRRDPDADLVEALRSRRNEAAETLVTRFGPRAYRLAARITGSTRDAEEVTQDVLWQIISKIHTFRGQAVFGSWVYRITANTAYRKLRRRSRERHEVSWEELSPAFDALGRHAAPITDWSPHVEDPAIQGELRAELSRAIEELPPELRAVLVMRDVDGMSNTEVAAALGMTVPAIKARLHRARLVVRERLSRFWTKQASAADPVPHRSGVDRTTIRPEATTRSTWSESAATSEHASERGGRLAPHAGIARSRETMPCRTRAASTAAEARHCDG